MEFKKPNKIQKFNKDIFLKDLKYHNYKISVSKEFSFDAAHHLHNYLGKCVNLHGHTYRLIVTFLGYPDDSGLVIDFSEIKSIFETKIKPFTDHRYLNESLPLMNTTAENIVMWCWEQISKVVDDNEDYKLRDISLESITLFETPTSSATITKINAKKGNNLIDKI